MLTNSFEDFVMTPIKCPPPKIVAVKRSLKKPKLKSPNIMDEDELSSKEDFINDDDSLSSFDSKDLIEFERDEPLIDLSENVEKSFIQDTVRGKNAKNSTTLLTLLEMLEIGNVTRAKETTRKSSCAQDKISSTIPFVSKTSSSSSLQNIPVECPSACAASSGKTDKLSTVFPPLSIEPENLSLVKNIAGPCEDSNSEFKETLKSPEGEERESEQGIEENFIDSALQNSHQCQKSENFISTSISFSRSGFDNCSIKSRCSEKSNESFDETLEFEEICDKENSNFCHYNHRNQHQKDVNFVKVPVKTDEKSDTNNNHESVCNQNSKDSTSLLTRETFPNSNESLKFLSPHTSQRKLPPKFYSSTNSLNQDCFEASSRLKRLEERFKGFSYTKKLLRSSRVFSKSEEILSSYGRAREFKPLNSLSSTTLSENCLRQLTVDKADEGSSEEFERKASSNNDISGEFFVKSSLAFPSVIIEQSLKRKLIHIR